MFAYQIVLTALENPTRRAVFERLRGGSLAVGELAEGLPVSRPAVSQHLRVLEAARLVRAERRGARRLYRATPDGLEALRRYLEGFWGEALAAFQAHAESGHGGPDGKSAG